MFISEALTRGVRVKVQSEYSSDQSAPSKNQWFFLYTVTISNESAETVQLLTRHWIITDGTGHIEEVRGPGVVGKQPTLKPGESFDTLPAVRFPRRSVSWKAPIRWSRKTGIGSTPRSRPSRSASRIRSTRNAEC